jgi:hypothetical protein
MEKKKEDGKAKDEKEISEDHHAKDDEVRLIFFNFLNPKIRIIRFF